MKQLYAYSNTKVKLSFNDLFDNIPFAFSCKYDCVLSPLQFIYKWYYCISLLSKYVIEDLFYYFKLMI